MNKISLSNNEKLVISGADFWKKMGNAAGKLNNDIDKTAKRVVKEVRGAYGSAKEAVNKAVEDFKEGREEVKNHENGKQDL